MRALSRATSAKLFATGFTVGPLVDSLHNQCLLQYDKLPISLEWPNIPLVEQGSPSYPYLFCSSWAVPPLLGIAYVVLGGILPRIFEAMLPKDQKGDADLVTHQQTTSFLRQRAWIAVATTALIIKLSEILETNPELTDGLALGGVAGGMDRAEAHLLILLVGAIGQWAILDGSLPALIAASITSIGGPLSELPFVANGFWEYIETAADYQPLAGLSSNLPILQPLLGDGYQNLALSSITGPCYFAVTMDAIALGRWFDAPSEDKDKGNDTR